MQVRILERTKTWAAVVKPAGISSEKEGMGIAIAQTLGIAAEQVYPVHRLDREVGGIMVYALSKKAAAFLSQASAEHKMKKTYLALVCGQPESPEGRWEDLLFHDRSRNKTFVTDRIRKGVKPAILDYQVVRQMTEPETDGQMSLLKITLQTGRTHQIRAQCASRGMPIAGDRRYGGRGKGEICLLAWKLSFPDPQTGTEKAYSLPMPEWAFSGELASVP